MWRVSLDYNDGSFNIVKEGSVRLISYLKLETCTDEEPTVAGMCLQK